MRAGEYPADLERDVALRDSGTIHLRPIRPDDVRRLQAFHSRLSRDSIFFRFFSPLPVLTDERAAYFTTVDYDRRLAIVAVEGTGAGDGADERAAYFTTVDYDRRLAIVAVEVTGAGDEQIVGVIRYDRTDDDTAELAIIVEDRYQHHGIGMALFWALVDAARARGIHTLAADILAENRRMINLLRDSGLPMTSRRTGNAIRVELDLSTGQGPA